MGNVVLTGGGSLFSGFADRLGTELSRNFPHVSMVRCTGCVASSDLYRCRLRYMRLETLLRDDMVVGWEVVSWRAWALSINYG
jgi:actin-related protein